MCKGKLHKHFTISVIAVIIAPLFTKALCEMGYCYEKLGQYPEALSKYDKVLKINPSHLWRR